MRIYNSPHSDVKLPSLDILTLLFDSEHCAAKEETKIHIEAANPENSITKAEARDLLRRVAHVLQERYSIGASGSGQDVVLSISSGSPFIPILFYSIVAAGGVYSGASTAFTVGELARQIQDAEAKVLLCSPEFEKHTVEAAEQCGIPLDRVLIIDAKKPKDWKLLTAIDRSSVLSSNGPMLEWKRITNSTDLQDTTACLLYSSGTTGLPKGVEISHWNLIAVNMCWMPLAQSYMDRKKAEGKPFYFSTIAHLPMAHIGGISWSSLIPFFAGGSAYWAEKYEFRSFIAYHKRYQLTVQWSVPPIWLAIARSPEVTDHFDSLEIAGTGAAPMSADVAKEAARKLGKGKIPIVTQLYGATETTGSITGVAWDALDETASSGAPFANVRCRFIDENGQDVGPGQPGELLVSGPFICKGYRNNPEANRNSFLDGFYRTGDIGVWKDGLIYIVDRLKELIKYKGLQVAPAELEALLLSHPKISDAAVIGVPDVVAGEVPRAFLVKNSGATVTALEIVKFVRENASDHKRLRGWVKWVDEIPKSASGKILRKELRRMNAEKKSFAML